MRAGLAREADVGAARVGLGRGVRVVDHHRFLVVGVHLLVELEQLRGVELVERGAAGGVGHLDEPDGLVAALRPGDDPTRLVGVVAFRVGDDRVPDLRSEGQHRPRVGEVGRRSSYAVSARTWRAQAQWTCSVDGGDQSLLQEGQPVVDVVHLRTRVVVGQRVPVLLVALLDAETSGDGETHVGERPHPQHGGLLVELDVDEQAVLGLGWQPGFLEGVDHRRGGPRLAVAQRALGEPAKVAGGLLVLGVRRGKEPGQHRVVGRARGAGEVHQPLEGVAVLCRGGRLVAQQLDQLGGERSEQVGLEDGERGDRGPAAAVPAEAAHLSSAFCIVAHRPYSCMAWTSRSISSRLPVETTERPSSCTSSISLRAFFFG